MRSGGFLQHTQEKTVHAGTGGHRKAAVLPCRHPGGQRYIRCADRKFRVTLQKGCDLLLIFCRVDGAGGVDQPPARLEQRRSDIQNCCLCGKQLCLPGSFQLL